jgi:hypothetical protein
MSEPPDPDSVQDSAERRGHERAERVEAVVRLAGDRLGQQTSPTTSEELATECADEPLDLPNETESLGSVFDRLVDERFEATEDAREALYRELTGPAASDDEYNAERDLTHLDEAVQDDVADWLAIRPGDADTADPGPLTCRSPQARSSAGDGVSGAPAMNT